MCTLDLSEPTTTVLSSANHLFVKICGVTNAEDAECCANAGADAIGILLTQSGGPPPSPESDRISIKQALEVRRSVYGRLKVFLLIHTLDACEVLTLANQIQPDALQLRDDVPRSSLRFFRERMPGVNLIRSVAVSQKAALKLSTDELLTEASEGLLDGVILDSPKRGSGVKHDWDVSARLIQSLGHLPTLLAGGLNAENLEAAVRRTSPFGVDVMSGVNASRRSRKSPDKISGFLRAARTQSIKDHTL